MNPSNRSFFISIPFEESSSIPFEESSSRFTQIYTSHYWSIIQKIHSPCEEMQKMRKKRSKWDLSCGCITQQHRYNTRQYSLEEEDRGIDALLRRAHRYIHVPPYIYIFGKHRDSPTSLDLSKRGLLLFFFLFFQTYLLQNRPCAFSRPLFPG